MLAVVLDPGGVTLSARGKGRESLLGLPVGRRVVGLECVQRHVDLLLLELVPPVRAHLAHRVPAAPEPHELRLGGFGGFGELGHCLGWVVGSG